MASKRDDMNAFDYLFCGICGGVLNVLIGYPLDTVKIKLQTMPVPRPGKKPLYTGSLDCIKKILRSEGIKGMYKGVTAPLLSATPSISLGYLGFGVGKWLFGDFLWYFPAGSASGVFYTTIMVPTERIKSLLQVQGIGRKHIYDNPRDVLRKLLKSGGLSSIYKGLYLGLSRDCVGSGVFFSTYYVLKDYLTDKGDKPISVFETITAGGLAGICVWLCILPIDTVKSRLQTAPEGTYVSSKQLAFDLIKNEGIAAFYKGLQPVLIRAFPANAACFFGFEYGKQLLDFLREI